MRIEVTSDSKQITAWLGQLGAVMRGAALTAIKQQTEETKRHARGVVAGGLRGKGRVQNTIRGEVYADTPAGFIHSTWGYFQGGKFVDILRVHAEGATILPRQRKGLLIPFIGRRQLRRGIEGRKYDFIPTPDGRVFIVRPGRRRGAMGQIVGMLAKRAVIPRRLDFRPVYAEAEKRLPEKLAVAIDRGSR